MSFQNADTERDLAILRHLQLRTKGQLGDERVDERLRIRLQAEPALKERNRRATGGILDLDVCTLWAKQQRRQEAPCASKQIGAQGAVPQRAAKRLRGGNREAVEVSPAVAEQPVAVGPAPLRLEDVWGFLQA